MIINNRDRIFYGQKLKSYLQKAGETLYMPNGVFHAVWNTLPSVAIGENPLYKTSFDEWIGSRDSSDWIRSRILLKLKGPTKAWITDIEEQINEAITL